MGKYRPIHHLVSLRILYMQIKVTARVYKLECPT